MQYEQIQHLKALYNGLVQTYVIILKHYRKEQNSLF